MIRRYLPTRSMENRAFLINHARLWQVRITAGHAMRLTGRLGFLSPIRSGVIVHRFSHGFLRHGFIPLLSIALWAVQRPAWQDSLGHEH